MKPFTALRLIKKSDGWIHRKRLAQDLYPGTKHDSEIHQLRAWTERITKDPKDEIANFFLAEFGKHMALAVCQNNSALFKEWAKSIDQWYKHKPNPDPMREAIILYCSPSNAEIIKLQQADTRQYRRIKSAWEKRAFRTRDIVDNLKSKGFQVNADTPRIVRRICTELKIRYQ